MDNPTVVNNKLSHALGVARSNYDNLKTCKVAAAVIEAVQKADASKWSMKLDEWIKLIESKPARSQSAHLTEKKEGYREEINRLTNNLLSAINTSTDDRVVTARGQLIAQMNSFRESVPIMQTDRTDWRVLLSISTLLSDNSKLAIYRGGWGDGSNKDRNQYSSGRLVPHAKSTGYKLQQPAPEHIWSVEEQAEIDKAEAEIKKAVADTKSKKKATKKAKKLARPLKI